MERAKPTFMIRKYRSILSAAIVVESVNYIITLTDGIIAGNMLGRDALVAIGLLSPFLALSLFMASIINSGTIMQLSSQIGAFRKQRALEFFSQGVYMALLTGAAYAAVLLAACDFVISWLSDVPVIREYMKIYFNTMLLFFVLNPLSYLLDNVVITDGGEKLSAVSNVVFIGSNIVLSYLLALLWGVRGVALVVLCSVLMKSPLGIWIGLACAPLFSLVICGLLVFRKCTKTDKREFPFLLSHDNDRNTFIYDFEINAENAVEKSRTADSVLRVYTGYPKRHGR